MRGRRARESFAVCCKGCGLKRSFRGACVWLSRACEIALLCEGTVGCSQSPKPAGMSALRERVPCVSLKTLQVFPMDSHTEQKEKRKEPFQERKGRVVKGGMWQGRR